MFGESFAFELARDPHERHARPRTGTEHRTLLDVERNVAQQAATRETDRPLAACGHITPIGRATKARGAGTSRRTETCAQ